MHRGSGLGVILTIVLRIVAVAGSSPVLSFPINSQVPPVATVSEPYSFSFSPSTFVSTTGSITYSLKNQPSWLMVDSASLVLRGTPTKDDIGAAVFQLQAADHNGATISSVTLLVVNSTGPQVAAPLLPQLESIGRTSSPDSLLLYPQRTFSFVFTSDTFSHLSPDTNFYAISANNSPLPSWIQFDASKLGFSGSSPPLLSPNAPPQTYGIFLIASDFPGFSQAVANFQIVVGYHILTFSTPVLNFNVTVGQPFSTSSLRGELLLDDTIASLDELSSVTSTAAGWLTLNVNDVSLSGTPTKNATSTTVIITVSDIFGDIANATVNLHLATNNTKLFNGSIPSAKAVIGQPFRYTLNASIIDTGTVSITANLRNASAWLNFDPKNLEFTGIVPGTEIPGIQVVTLTASSADATEEANFDILIQRERIPLSSSSTPLRPSATRTSSSSTSSSTPTATNNTGPWHRTFSDKRVLAIVLLVGLPTLASAIFGCLLLCLCRKRKRASLARESTPSAAETPPIVQESAEQLLEQPVTPSDPQSQSSRQVTPTGPPRVELPWGPDSLRLSRNRISKRLRAKQGDSLDSWGGLIAMAPELAESSERVQAEVPEIQPCHLRAAPDSTSASTLMYSRKRPPLQLTRPKPRESSSKRVSKALSGVSIASAGLPNRLSGAGHGSGGLRGPHDIRSSQQTTLGPILAIDRRTSTLVLDSFSSPPRGNEPEQSVVSLDHLATIRFIHSDSIAPSDSLEAQRQKWHTERARDHLEGAKRFSSAWSSRQHLGSRDLIDTSRYGRKLSPTMRSDAGNSTRTTRSWSQWSAAGPAAARAPTKLRLQREESLASSGQFDSSRSSGSQWEDEILVEEEDEAGKRHWQRTAREDEGGTQSPRLPFGVGTTCPSQDAQEGVIAPPRALRLVDNRRPVSMESGEIQRSQRSHQGSLRFI